MFKGYRVVTVTPAGRRRYLELLARYLLRDRGLIDAHEWWVNTDVAEDLAFLEQLCDRYPDFFYLVPMPSPVLRGGNRIFRIGEFGPRASDQQTIYIRFDDDIVYVEEGTLRSLLEFRISNPNPFLVYPCIINNAIMIHLFQRRGLLPRALGFCEYHAFGNGFRDKGYAEAVHRCFLSDLHNGNLDPWRFGHWQLHCYERVCVNCICWFGGDFAEFGGNVGRDEEKFLSCDKPQQISRPNVIFGHPIVAHFSYRHQNSYLDTTDLLAKYTEVCNASLPPLEIKSESSHLAALAGPPPHTLVNDETKMKLAYVSSPSHDSLRDDVFLKSLREAWDLLEVRFDIPGSGSYQTASWKDIVVRRFAKYAEIARQNLNQVVVFSDTDIQWLKPVQSLLKKALEEVDMVFQREWHEKYEVNAGFIAARCTREVIKLLDYVAQKGNAHESDQYVINQVIAQGEMPCSFDYLPDTFANDHLIPFVPLETAVLYHSIRSLPIHHKEETVAIKLRQHRFIESRTTDRERPSELGIGQFIGQELVFGRLFRGKNTALEPLGTLSLESGGKITGYENPQESTWQAKDGALSFFHADRNTVTSSFNQTIDIAGVPVAVGVCFTQPLIHFLCPYRPLGEGARILYLIASHYNDQVPLAILLPQLAAAGVRPEELWITVAQSPIDEIKVIDGITHSYVRENAYEFTALGDVAHRDIPFDYAYLLHDSCHVGLRFKQLAQAQPGLICADYMPVLSSGEFNIGLYRREFLLQNSDYLRSLRGTPNPKMHTAELRNKAAVVSSFLDARVVRTGLRQPYGDPTTLKGHQLVGADIHHFSS